MAKRKKSSMRMRFIGSYMGVVLCACVLIGLLGLSRAINEITAAGLTDYREKIRLAAEDLYTQQEILENISYRVKTSPMYRPFFTYRNAYYETEIVEDIAKYRDYSPLIDEYYCILQESDSVYSPNGKLTADHFAYYRLQTDRKLLDAFFMDTAFRVMEHPARKDVLMMLLPFRVKTDGQRGIPDACLVFMVSKQTMAERIERIGALDTAGLAVYWKDILLLGDEQAVTEDPSLCVKSEKGEYRIYFSMQSARFYRRLNDFRSYFMLLLTLGTSVLLAASAYVAHRSYRPIDRLMDRLYIPKNCSENDVEAAVKALQDGQRNASEQLQSDLIDIARQRREIAKQLLFAKLNGMRDAQLDVLLAEAGIALNHPLFCVMLIHFADGQDREDAVSALTRSLSDDDLNIYPAGMYRAQEYIVLTNFVVREQVDEICTVLRESLEVETSGAALYVGDVCEGMGRLSLSFISAVVRRETEYAYDAPQLVGGESNWYDDRQIRLMLQSLKEGDLLKAQTCMAEAIRMMGREYPSVMLQRCIWADIGSQLLRTAKEMNVALEQRDLHMLMMAADAEQFGALLADMLDRIAAASNERTALENGRMEQEVVDYIRENLFSPQFTMAQAAEQFGISERKIGYVVKQVTGISYKEFIIQLRMERAKAMLTQEGYNVSQTSESIGYSNIPYFIKTFRNYAGYTPGEYKKLFEKQEEETR